MNAFPHGAQFADDFPRDGIALRCFFCQHVAYDLFQSFRQRGIQFPSTRGSSLKCGPPWRPGYFRGTDECRSDIRKTRFPRQRYRRAGQDFPPRKTSGAI